MNAKLIGQALFFCVVLGFIGTSTLQAQIPEQLQFRGFLTSSDGIPVDCPGPLICSTPPTIVVRIYTDAEADIAPIYEETHEAVLVDKGVFDLPIGVFLPVEPFLFNQPLFLGIDVDGDGEALPRLAIVSVPTAFQAINAQSLDGLTPDDFVKTDEVGVLVGPQGEKGETGEKGATGPQGPQGPAGAGLGGNLVHASNNTVQGLSTNFQDTSIAVTITPQGSAPKILVLASVMSYVFSNSGNVFGILRFTRNGEPLLGSQVIQHAQSPGGIDHANTMTLMFVDNPTGPGPFTYRVQARVLDESSPTSVFKINFAGDETLSSNIIAQEF